MNGEKFVKVSFGVIEALESEKIKPSSLALYTVLKKLNFSIAKPGNGFIEPKATLQMIRD